jgi:hypothetical protein
MLLTAIGLTQQDVLGKAEEPPFTTPKTVNETKLDPKIVFLNKTL